MSEFREIPIKVGKKNTTLALGRCAIAIFRLDPEKDYLDIWEDADTEEAQEHAWVFRNHELLIWLGGVCLSEDDQLILNAMNRENAEFTERSGGWRPPVMVEDRAQPYEEEMYTQSFLQDLGDFPPSW